MNDNQIIKNVIDRNGKIIIVTDMDALLASQEDVRESFDHYVLTCPACIAEKRVNYTKKKLYVKKDKSVGFCQRCHSIFVPWVNVDIDNIVLPNVPQFSVMEKDQELAKIPEVFKGGVNYYHSANHISDDLLEYLKGRRSSAVIRHMPELDFRCYNDQEIIIPFRFNDEVIYYQINYRNPGNLKYFNPPIKHKPLYILNQHTADINAWTRLVLCEGIYDAIALRDFYPDDTIAAVLGCNITEYHIWMMRKLLPNEIYIFMDTTELSRKVMQQLVGKIPTVAKFTIIESNGKDADEILKEYDSRTN